MKNVMHYVERYEQEDPHPVVPQVMDRLEAGPTGRHTLRRMNESELNDWSTAEIIFEAAKRHPLPTTDFVNLVLSTGSPIWTYSLRQMRRLFDMIDPEMDNYLSEAALEEALETDMEIRSQSTKFRCTQRSSPTASQSKIETLQSLGIPLMRIVSCSSGDSFFA